MYPEEIVAPMRQELVDAGFTELKSAADVDEAVGKGGTALFVVNSVCGCAAGMARPGVRLALEHADKKPDHLFTVFAGNDGEATDAVRSTFTGYPPSSPCMGLLKDGQLVSMVQRMDIEGFSAQDVAAKLVDAFNDNC